MREINNKNFDVNQLQKTELKKDAPEPAEQLVLEPQQEEKVIKDFSNPTEVLGRSQVSKADNLKADISFALENKDAVEKADKFFDLAYAVFSKEGDSQAYEKASAVTSLYAKELHK